jgi:pimeloyl-ACP methyl ester carboxylesterase
MFLSLLLLLAAFVPAADGVPIHYTVEGKGDPALVFVHCLGCDRHLWDNQVPVFSKNHRVVTIDLPGHGESGKARKDYSIAGYGDDVKRVITKLDLKRVVLIGSSMGGPVALEAARLMPERVVAIVPVDTLHNVAERMPAEQVDAILKKISADYKGETTKFMNQYLFAPTTPAAVKERLLSQATSLRPEMALRILRAAMTYDPTASLKMIKVPIRAINADLTPTNLENNRKHAPQFDAVIIKGVGHYPMLEDPVRFNELLKGVLNDLRM